MSSGYRFAGLGGAGLIYSQSQADSSLSIGQCTFLKMQGLYILVLKFQNRKDSNLILDIFLENWVYAHLSRRWSRNPSIARTQI